MQFQIECNSGLLTRKACVICQKKLVAQEAKIIICDEQGNSHGEVCSHCIGKGLPWLNKQLQQLHLSA